MKEGQVIFQVLVPSPVIMPDGNRQFGILAMTGTLKDAFNVIEQARPAEYVITSVVALVSNLKPTIDTAPQSSIIKPGR